jgi:diadenosine tetraphosphate (Ap4A) HIT family hydrolase
MDSGMNENMDSLQNHLKNISKEDMEKAQKMMDSASKMLNEMKKNAK